jgi:glycosyltransferase involved in cell wall biosynthesis
MRVLHVAAPAAFGGLEQVVSTLAAAQRAGGDEVHVATLSADPGAAAFCGPLARQGITTHLVDAPPRGYWRQHGAIVALGRRIRPDVVHTHGYQADVIAGPAGRRTASAVVTTLHGFTRGGFRNRCYEWLQRRLAHRCDAIIAVSEAIARELAATGVPDGKLHVIPNVLPPPGPRLTRKAARRALGVGEERWVVGWVGRLSREKGLDLLLDALALDPHPEYDLVVMGDGPERDALVAQAEQLGLSDRVTWAGVIPGAERYFAGFDLLVLSSRTEGSPIVLLEAMAAGTPIVATAVGGVTELLTPLTAALVPPEDPAALRAAIGAVHADPARARRRALRARDRAARRADPFRWASRYAEAYGAALARRDRGP